MREHAVPSPEDITRAELPNGIVVLARSNFNSPSISVSGSIQAGSLFDPDEKLGLADFAADGLMRGTEKRNFQKIFDDLESVGASLGFNGGTHTTGFGGKALAEDLDLILGLLAETLRQPVFPKNQIEKLRAQMLTGLALRAQSTGDMASLTFDKLVYREHPYSRPDDGYPETVRAITIEDLQDFHQKIYGPRGMHIAIVGGVEPEKAVEKVKAAFGDWENPEQPEPPELPEWQPLPEGASQRVEIPGKSQSDLKVGTAGPPRSSEDYMAASLGNNIFGSFGLMGRIGDVVREQAGLAYYAYSSLSGSIGPAPWSVTAGVNPANEKKAIELIKQEIKRFATEKVTEEELSDSQTNYIGRMPLTLESNAGVAGALLHIERHNLGLDYYVRYPDIVRAVSREQILETAGKYLDSERMATAVAGPPKAEE